MRSLSKKNKKIWIAGIILLIIIALFFFRDSIFGSEGAGKIILLNLEGNSTIFLDNKQVRTIRGGNDKVSLSRIEPGFHTVLVAREGHWPWLKEIELSLEEEINLFPFSVPQSSSGVFIPEEDPEYESIISLFEKSSLPDIENKIEPEDGRTAIWISDGSLFVEWLGEEQERPEYFCNEFGCHNVIASFTTSAGVRNLDFFKDRNDVFIISFGTGVFAIEADRGNNQNFQPIFEGQSPEFALDEDGLLYVLDNNFLSLIAI